MSRTDVLSKGQERAAPVIWIQLVPRFPADPSDLFLTLLMSPFYSFPLFHMGYAERWSASFQLIRWAKALKLQIQAEQGGTLLAWSAPNPSISREIGPAWQ